MKAIILAGGKGKRLLPYTTVIPKPLMPIGDYSVLEVLLRQLKYYGFSEVILAVGYLSQLINAFCGDGGRFGLKIRYSYENEPLGTAGPISLVDSLNETFLVMNGDLLTSLNFKSFIDFHNKNSAAATIGIYNKEVGIDLGVMEIADNNLIKKYTEKPKLNYFASMGIYAFEPFILKYLRKNEKLDLPVLINLLLEKNEKVVGYISNDFWLDIGRPEDYEEAVNIFSENKNIFLKG